MKRFFTFIFILLLIVAGYFIYQKFGQAQPKEINNFSDCAAKGNPVTESYPRQCSTNGKTFTEDVAIQTGKEDKIIASKPQALDTVENPIIIEGQARGSWFFEASFPVKLVDASGNILGTGLATTSADWTTDNFIPFRAELKYNATEDGSGRIILARDNPSGLAQNDDSIEIPVHYKSTIGQMKVKVFFQNAELDAATDYDCGKVLATEREVDQTESVAQAALEELLKGPTAAEKDLGFTTMINDRVKVQSLTIDNGVAKADFSADLENGVSGSCRVAGIEAQIIETLKQFSTVKSVVISIDGQTEDILQP